MACFFSSSQNHCRNRVKKKSRFGKIDFSTRFRPRSRKQIFLKFRADDFTSTWVEEKKSRFFFFLTFAHRFASNSSDIDSFCVHFSQSVPKWKKFGRVRPLTDVFSDQHLSLKSSKKKRKSEKNFQPDRRFFSPRKSQIFDLPGGQSG